MNLESLENNSELDQFYNSKSQDRRESFVQRKPMNQMEFDEKFEYSKPKAENELKKTCRKFVRRFYEPFTSLTFFKLFILDFFPILKWLPNYNWRNDLSKDLIGGLTVGIMHIPQGVAYSLLAKQPAINGLYTSLIPPFIYMIFGTSRHSSLGTFAIVSLMTGITVEKLSLTDIDQGSNQTLSADNFPPTPTEISCVLTLTVGFILLLMAFLRLQFLTTYLSDQVIAGFTTGSSVHVLVSQFKPLLGIRNVQKHTGVFYLFRTIYELILALPQANILCCGISLTAIVLLLIGKELVNPFIKKLTNLNVPIPWELIVVIASTIFLELTNFDVLYSINVVNQIPTGLPRISFPRFDLIPKVLPDAISITIVSISIWLSISKMLAKKNDYELNPGQELYALSISSIFSSFFPIVPSSCSLSRTLVAIGASVTTQLSILFSSTLVLIVIFFLGKYLEKLPMCVLASIIIVALKGMFKKFSDLRKLWNLSKIDFMIWIVSFLSTVLIDVSEGLIISVCFALFTTILREQYPKWHILASVKGTPDFRDSERYGEIVYFKGICIFRFDAPLLFHNVECFKKSVDKAYKEWQKSHEFYVLREERGQIFHQQLENDSHDEKSQQKSSVNANSSNILSRHFVIDCSGFTFIDLMGVSALKEIFSDLRKRGILVYFANAKAPVREMFEKCDFYKFVSKENFYPTMKDAISIARQRQMELGFKDTGYIPEHDRLTEVLSSHPM